MAVSRMSGWRLRIVTCATAHITSTHRHRDIAKLILQDSSQESAVDVQASAYNAQATRAYKAGCLPGAHASLLAA